MRTSSLTSRILLLIAVLFAHISFCSGQAAITWTDREFGAISVTNNGGETLEVTYQWAGEALSDYNDLKQGERTSGSNTIVLEPGESRSDGGHSIKITSASIISSRVDPSARINKQIDDLEAEIARLDSDPKTRDIEAKISTAESIRNRIRDDRDLTAQDRSFLLAKIQAKIDRLESLSLDKKSKKAAMLSQLQSLRAQLSN